MADLSLTGIDPIHRCYALSERCESTYAILDSLRIHVAEANHPDMTVILRELDHCGHLLSAIAHESDLHPQRIPVTRDHLRVVTPSLYRTLRDIEDIYRDTSICRIDRWRRIYHKDVTRTNVTLAQRFMVYKSYLCSLKELLIGSPEFDANLLEDARVRILVLRQARGLRT